MVRATLCRGGAAYAQTTARHLPTPPTPLPHHHPAGKLCQYLVMDGNVLEIQRVAAPTPASWFVDDSIVAGTEAMLSIDARPSLLVPHYTRSTPATTSADGSVLVATRVDPLFMLLPLLAADTRFFCPLAQYLSHSTFGASALPAGSAAGRGGSDGGDGDGGGDGGDGDDGRGSTTAPRSSGRVAGATLLASLHGLAAAAASVCDVRQPAAGGGGGEDEEVTYRLNRERAVACLAARARHLAHLLHSKAGAARAALRTQFGAFSAASSALVSSGTTVAATAASVSSAEPEAAASPPLDPVAVDMALGILGEYLAEEWVTAVAEAVGYATRACVTHVANTAAPRTHVRSPMHTHAVPLRCDAPPPLLLPASVARLIAARRLTRWTAAPCGMPRRWRTTRWHGSRAWARRLPALSAGQQEAARRHRHQPLPPPPLAVPPLHSAAWLPLTSAA